MTRRQNTPHAQPLDSMGTISRTQQHRVLKNESMSFKRTSKLLLIVSMALSQSLLIAGQSYAISPNAQMQEMWKLYAHTRLLDTKQFYCLDTLWTMESHWNNYAKNDHSSAFGIAQVLHTRTTDPYKQIDQGLIYITHRYKEPCIALHHHLKTGTY
jgi:hypothetical protein